jgi:hypothetical protein
MKVLAAAAFVAIVAAHGVALAEAPKDAQSPRMMVLPALLLVRGNAGVTARGPRPAEVAEERRLDELTSTLRDAAPELGYEVELTPPEPPLPEDDAELLEFAERDHVTYVVSALEQRGSGYRLRVAVASPGRAELRVRYADVAANDVPAKGLVLLRALLRQAEREVRALPVPTEAVVPKSPVATASELRVGRAILATNAGVLGALTGFSVQRASGSDDPRVLFPLLALGAGAGLAGGLVVADEFELDANQALFLASGAWWGVGAGLLVANGRDVTPFSDRYLWGIGGGVAGAALSAAWSARRRMDSGGLVLENSGAVFGMALGGLSESFVRANTTDPPRTGGGIGAMAGLALAAGTASFVRVPTGRILLVDLGGAVGGLAGAAIASPLVFQNVTDAKARGFFAAAAGGVVAGGALTWWLTRRERVPRVAWLDGVTPTFGVIGSSATREGSVPAWGFGFAGRL